MNVVAFKSREFAARIGAVVVAFVLAFSLVSLTAPARADGELDMKMWLEYSFSGDNVTFSYRYHNTMQGSDHKTMCNKYGDSSAYGDGLKYGITQYDGVEVCEMQATIKIDQFISSNGTAVGFGADDKLYREGSNIVYEGDLSVFSDATSAKFIDYKITFAGGVVSAEGAEVSGNTANLKLGGKFKVVGNPGSGSSMAALLTAAPTMAAPREITRVAPLPLPLPLLTLLLLPVLAAMKTLLLMVLQLPLRPLRWL